jgi:nicotinate-nucleotide adenylyltransferase
MKVALFGGSFNPPQNGHVAVAKALLDSQQFDEVWVLPNYHHPFGKNLAPFEDRLHLCRLAFEGLLSPSLKVSGIEKEVDPPEGYTIDTVRFLKKKFPEHEFFLVMGSDLLLELPRWKEYADLKKMIEIYPISRAEYEESQFPRVSSTEIREALRRGQDISSLVPPKVAKYIREKKLYS